MVFLFLYYNYLLMPDFSVLTKFSFTVHVFHSGRLLQGERFSRVPMWNTISYGNFFCIDAIYFLTDPKFSQSFWHIYLKVYPSTVFTFSVLVKLYSTGSTIRWATFSMSIIRCSHFFFIDLNRTNISYEKFNEIYFETFLYGNIFFLWKQFFPTDPELSQGFWYI